LVEVSPRTATILDLIEAGLTVTEIRKELGLSIKQMSDVIRKAREKGIIRHIRRGQWEVVAPYKIRPLLTELQKQYLYHIAVEEMTPFQIAAHYGKHLYAVQKQIYRMVKKGVLKRRKRGRRVEWIPSLTPEQELYLKGHYHLFDQGKIPFEKLAERLDMHPRVLNAILDKEYPDYWRRMPGNWIPEMRRRKRG